MSSENEIPGALQAALQRAASLKAQRSAASSVTSSRVPTPTTAGASTSLQHIEIREVKLTEIFELFYILILISSYFLHFRLQCYLPPLFQFIRVPQFLVMIQMVT